MEHLALSRLKSHLTISANFCPHQSAYRSAHSTETALIKIVDDIESDSVVGLVSLDISVAFDTVFHERLLDKLKSKFGIDSAPLRWIDSYLKSRRFSVQLGRSWSSVTPGVVFQYLTGQAPAYLADDSPQLTSDVTRRL